MSHTHALGIMVFERFFAQSIISSLADALKDIIVLVGEMVYAIGWMAFRLTEN